MPASHYNNTMPKALFLALVSEQLNLLILRAFGLNKQLDIGFWRTTGINRSESVKISH